MPSTRDRKRKPTANESEVVVRASSDKSKARRVSTDASASIHATTSRETTASAVSTTITGELSMESIGQMLQDLFHSDGAEVDAAFDVFLLDLEKDRNKCESLVTAGGYVDIFYLMKNRLDKANESILACDQFTELDDSAELATLHKALLVIRFSFLHDEGKEEISGVEAAVVRAMKTFPKCEALLQESDVLSYTPCYFGVLASCWFLTFLDTYAILILISRLNR